MESTGYTAKLNVLLSQWRGGDDQALDEILIQSQDRLRRMASRRLSNFPAAGRWHQTDDVLQNALIRLNRSLKEVQPKNKRQFHGLVATQIRRELLDLAKNLNGPQGRDRNHATAPADPNHAKGRQMPDPAAPSDSDYSDQDMVAFHEAVTQLEPDVREVFELRYYQGMSRAEVAELLEVSEKTIQRRYREAKLALSQKLRLEN